MLQDLEAAGAFVVSLDADRTWFRYHQMFAGLLRLELRRTEPGEVTGLHAAAAGWLAARGFAVEAVRHAQAAGDWELAARLLAGHWPGLHLDGQAATVHELLAGFPAEARAADAELAVVAAADELAQGSLEAAGRYLTLAGRQSAWGQQAGENTAGAFARGGAAAAGLRGPEAHVDDSLKNRSALPLFLLPLSNADVAAEGLQIHRSLTAKARTEEAVGGTMRSGGAMLGGHGHFVYKLALHCFGEKLERRRRRAENFHVAIIVGERVVSAIGKTTLKENSPRGRVSPQP